MVVVVVGGVVEVGTAVAGTLWAVAPGDDVDGFGDFVAGFCAELFFGDRGGPSGVLAPAGVFPVLSFGERAGAFILI